MIKYLLGNAWGLFLIILILLVALGSFIRDGVRWVWRQIKKLFGGEDEEIKR